VPVPTILKVSVGHAFVIETAISRVVILNDIDTAGIGYTVNVPVVRVWPVALNVAIN
jgi:hypothetical protein